MTDDNPLLDKVSPGFNLIVGKPASGKSFLMRYLLMTDHPDFNKAPIRYGVVFTTTKFNRFWEEVFPADYIHQRYDQAALQGLLDIQTETGAANRAVVIFDDCLDQKAFTSQLFLNLSTTYRHYNLDVYLTTQYVYRVPPTVRECCTRVAIFRTTTERSLKACYDSFGAFFANFLQFREFIIGRTGDYCFIWYIANSSAEERDQVYRVLRCPRELPAFKFEY
jgi:hypothetical protein